MDVTLLVVYVGLTLGVSFICSLLEAAFLSVRVATLSERMEGGSKGAGILLDLKKNRLEDAISAILTLNTIANTAGASLAGYQAKVVFQSWPVGIFAAILTVLVLVISEIIPKTTGAVHATALSGVVGRTVGFLITVMAPLLVITRAITRVLAPATKTPITRRELAVMVTTAHTEGTLEKTESRLFENVLRFEEIQVEDIMTPRTVTFMLPAETTLGECLDNDDATAYSRIPLYRDNRDQVVGYLFQREVLLLVARGANRDAPTSDFMRDVWFIPEKASLADALREFQRHREPFAMVVDEHDGIAGIITIEDLMETILGVEIIDESDQVVDLRQKAARMREERMVRLKKRQASRLLAAAPPREEHPEDQTESSAST